MKRVVTIQDLSCFGKCSITAALPVISAMGVECAVLPTAVLSAHTGFPGSVTADLGGEMAGISRHWKDLGLTFDVIYTGYLASAEQIHQVLAFLEDFRTPATRVLVDPVMADDGRLYPGFDPAFPREMAKLCRQADLITPNWTEACLLAGLEGATLPQADSIAAVEAALCGMGCGAAAITGVRMEPDEIAVCTGTAAGDRWKLTGKRFPGSLPGAGDVFAAVCAGALALGYPVKEALETAEQFATACIEATLEEPASRRYGMAFETQLGQLTKLADK